MLKYLLLLLLFGGIGTIFEKEFENKLECS